MDYKNLSRKLQATLADIQKSDDVLATVHAMLQRLVDDFGHDLGLTHGRIYEAEGTDYVLREEYPEGKAPTGFRIPMSYEPARELIEHGFVRHNIDELGEDQKIMHALGVTTFAAIGVGDPPRHIVAFSLKPNAEPEQVDFTLTTLRHVINLRLRQIYLEDRVAASREIQMSLLPRHTPEFGDFDIWGETLPAEEVGGDLYDYIELSDRVFGFAIADASGHGLPAALQARDAIIGIRMGMEETLRITVALEKLNRVISRSALASRFISLFYAEIDLDGLMVYCNAGHPPPLLLDHGEFTELTRGGLILGPKPDAHYARGYVVMNPGAILVAYTDGISEAENPSGESFGVDRLRDHVLSRSRSWSSSRDLAESVLDEVRRFSGGDPLKDDQTVVVIARRAKAQ
ncbi:MAG: PP2C family protein-serine/threonine phosphatase [Acidobacteriota bacterium]|nr:PP2C family protein-serine/threonine phosphatase [Acidobacteriota bacterium]